MEFATGAMSSLLPKLGKLLLEEYDLQTGLKKRIKDLRDELLIIEAALLKVSDVPLDQLDPVVKIWANDARELSYAIEDSLDSFLVRIEGPKQEKPHNFFAGFIMTVTMLKTRHEIAGDIKNIESQVMKIKERYDRYKIDDIVANILTTVDPRLSALYNKVSDLVGIDGPIDDLTKVLSEDVETSQNNLKIFSIVGFGGLGKTTLAKALYDKLSSEYQCGCFVPVGRNQRANKVLRDILLELDNDIELYKAASTMDEWQLINRLQKFLAGKRYFIVIDDLWDIPTWQTIKFAFVHSHPESRIIITTRMLDVAMEAGCIYHMKPLSDENSKTLFHTRTGGAEGVSDNQPGEVINKILKKCGGVPLAIITIASLLAGKPSADWSKVYDAIGFGTEDSEVIKNTRKILSFSYYDLPSNLKACLLYLSMFPEDYFIEKKSLIWRWIIEGFVHDKPGIGSYELGEIVFNKLVNKSMIKFIEPDGYIGEKGEGGCRVHDMVLDFIRTMSDDLNFVKITDMEEHVSYSRGIQTGRIHRLALHGRSAEHNISVKMDHVRSFNAMMCGGSEMPLLSRFKVLRVLVIEKCDFLEDHSLEHLGKLVQLRYLGLVKTAVKLPEGIGYDLKFLEILDVRGGLISKLPPSVGELKNLRCLWADDEGTTIKGPIMKGTIMEGKIGKLTSLEELQLPSVECPNFFKELGNLTNLRKLIIEFDESVGTESKALAGSLCNLHKIESLIIMRTEFYDISDFNYKEFHVHGRSLEDLAPSSRLQNFLLQSVIIPRVPSWIDSLCVPLLSTLWLHVEVVEARDLQSLGRFPSLCLLFLESRKDKRISYTFGSAEFQKLEMFSANIEIALGEGALPMVEILDYSASAGRKDSLVPWKNRCPLLESITCLLDCANCGWKEVKAAERVLLEACPDAEDFGCQVERVNYDRKAARLIDALGLIQHDLDRPNGMEDITADRRDIRRMIKSLETLLRDDDEPRVGMYGKQELQGIVTRLKNSVHNHAGIQEEEADESDASWGSQSGSEDYNDDEQEDVDDDDDSDDNGDDCDDDDDDDDDDEEEAEEDTDEEDNDDEGDNHPEQEEADNDVATSSTGHQQGASSQP